MRFYEIYIYINFSYVRDCLFIREPVFYSLRNQKALIHARKEVISLKQSFFQDGINFQVCKIRLLQNIIVKDLIKQF